MERGWSLKKLYRLILNSATYRQSSSVANRRCSERDPYNRLLARGPRLRVEAEIVRDITLAASGLLNPRIGGPSVFPPAPEFLFVSPPPAYGPKIWDLSEGEDRYRRALYTFRYRSVPYPMLQTFDAPNGDSACVRRSRSNTPLQALTALNEPLFMEAAQALALKTLQEGGQKRPGPGNLCLPALPGQEARNRKKARNYSRCCRNRPPVWRKAGSVPGELPVLTRKRRPELPAGATPVQLAAWTTVSRVLLNLDETITKE